MEPVEAEAPGTRIRGTRVTPLQWAILGIIITSVVLHGMLLLFAPVDGHDADTHIRWLTAFSHELTWGHLYPRWLGTAFAGYGAPIFYIYPPGAFYVGAMVAAVTTATTGEVIFKFVALIGYLLSLLSMRLLLREMPLTPKQVWYGALIFAFSPYRYFTLFTRSALPEHLAIAIIPLVLWAAYRVIARHAAPKYVAILALSIAALIFTNIPSAVATLMAIAVMGIGAWHTSRRSVAGLGVGITLGVLASSALLLPVVKVKKYLMIERLWHPLDHSPLMEIVNSGYYLNRTLLPVLFIVLVVACWAWMKHRSQDGKLWRNVLLLVVVIELPAIAHILSPYFLPLRLLQFPWRIDAVGFAVLIPLLFIESRRVQFALIGLIGAGLLLTAVTGFATLTNSRAGNHAIAPTDMRPEYFSRYMTQPNTSSILADSTQDAVAAGNLLLLKQDSRNRTYKAVLAGPQTVVLKLYYWPYWTALVNGHAAPLRPDRYGRTLIDLPKGESRIDLRLAKSSAERVGEWITVLTMLVLGAIAMLPQRITARLSGLRLPIEAHSTKK